MIGVIADDLTGAAEIGAIGLRHGLQAEILLMNSEPQPEGQMPASGNGFSTEIPAPTGTDGPNLICVDTDSRGCNSQEAARRAAGAAQILRRGGARWIYKKVDSVLRGQVMAEVEAVLDELRYKRALLAPANPSLGRVIQGGRYWVRGRLIHRTEFARDPEHPRNSCRVVDMLKPPGRLPVRVIPRGPLPDDGIIVGEAATTRDVNRWAGFLDESTLPAGGADFFNASVAADRRKMRRPIEAIADPAGRRELFICGTPSRAARQFLRDARSGKTPIFSLPSELAWGAEFTPAAMTAIGRRIVDAFQLRQRVILCVGLPMVRETRIAVRLSACLAQIAAFVLRQVNLERVYAEGGMTATEVVRQMSWRRLTVVRELAPGVATLAVEGNTSQVLIIKPGSYPWPRL